MSKYGPIGMRPLSYGAVREFARNGAGATAVEFALLMAPLIAIVLAALQTAIIFAYDQALQSVTQTAARQLMTGRVQTSNLTQAQFQSAVCGYASPLFQCGGLMVDVESGSTFSAISTASLTPTYDSSGSVTNTWSYKPGAAGDIVIIRVMYDWPVVGGPMALGLANQSNGTRLLVGTAVIKNEPYG